MAAKTAEDAPAKVTTPAKSPAPEHRCKCETCGRLWPRVTARVVPSMPKPDPLACACPNCLTFNRALQVPREGFAIETQDVDEECYVTVYKNDWERKWHVYQETCFRMAKGECPIERMASHYKEAFRCCTLTIAGGVTVKMLAGGASIYHYNLALHFQRPSQKGGLTKLGGFPVEQNSRFAWLRLRDIPEIENKIGSQCEFTADLLVPGDEGTEPTKIRGDMDSTVAFFNSRFYPHLVKPAKPVEI